MHTLEKVIQVDKEIIYNSDASRQFSCSHNSIKYLLCKQKNYLRWTSMHFGNYK